MHHDHHGWTAEDCAHMRLRCLDRAMRYDRACDQRSAAHWRQRARTLATIVAELYAEERYAEDGARDAWDDLRLQAHRDGERRTDGC